MTWLRARLEVVNDWRVALSLSVVSFVFAAAMCTIVLLALLTPRVITRPVPVPVPVPVTTPAPSSTTTALRPSSRRPGPTTTTRAPSTTHPSPTSSTVAATTTTRRPPTCTTLPILERCL